MPKHRAQLLLMSEEVPREELAGALKKVAHRVLDSLPEKYDPDEVELLVIDDMEDED